MESTISLTFNEKLQLRQLLSTLLPRQQTYYSSTYDRDNNELKKNIFIALKCAKNQLDQKTWIVDTSRKIMRENSCLPEKKIERMSPFKEEQNGTNIDLQTGFKNLRQKLFDQEKDSQTYFALMGLLQQLKNLNEKGFMGFRMKLFQLKENYLFRDCLFQIATRCIKPSGDTVKIVNLLGVIMRHGPAEVFDDLKGISNPQLKQQFERLIQFMLTDCVHVTKRSNPLNEFLRVMSQYLSSDTQILSALNSLPDKIKLICRPLYQQFIRLRQKNNNQVKSRTNIPSFSGYSQYLDPRLKQATDESIQQLVKDCSLSKQQNDQLQKQLRDIKQCLTNLNRIGSSEEAYSQIEKSLNKFDEQTEHTLGRIYKQLRNYLQMSKQKQLDTSFNSTDRKNFSYSFYRSPDKKQPNSSFTQDKNISPRYQENDQDLKSRLQRTQQQIKRLRKNSKSPSDKELELIEQNQQLKAEVHCLKEELKERIEQNRSLKTQASRMSSEYKNYKNTSVSRRSDDPKEQSESFIEMLKDSKAQIKENGEIQSLRKQIKLEKEKNNNLIYLIQDYQKKLQHYEKNENSKSYDDLKKQNTELVKLLLLKKENKRTESTALSQLQNIKENNAKSIQRYNELEDQTSSLRNQQSTVKAQNQKLKMEIANINQELKALRQSKMNFTQQRQKMKDLSQTFNSLKKKYGDLNCGYEDLQRQNNQLKERLFSPSNNSQSSTPKKQQKFLYQRRQTNNKYNELLQSSAKRENELKKQIDLKQAQLMGLKSLHNNSELSLAPMRDKVTYLQNSIKQLNKDLNWWKAQAAKKQQQTLELKSKLNQYQQFQK